MADNDSTDTGAGTTGATDIRQQDTPPQDTAPQDTAPQDTAPQDTAPQDTPPQDSAPQDSGPAGTEPAAGEQPAAGPAGEDADGGPADAAGQPDGSGHAEADAGPAGTPAAVAEPGPAPKPAAEPGPAPEPAAESEPAPASEAEPELPRFGAQFSSPEPTAVVARPRRRATRPAAAPEPDELDPVAVPAPAAPVPAFVSFVAPTATEAAPPRRRGRRAAESPAPESPDAESAAAGAGTEGAQPEDEEAARPRRGRSRRRSGGRAATDEGAVEDRTDDRSDQDRSDEEVDTETSDDVDEQDTEDRDEGPSGTRRRRRGRRGRGRGRSGDESDENGEGRTDTDAAEDETDTGEDDTDTDTDAEPGTETDEDEGAPSGTRRRRRRRRRGGGGEDRAEEPEDDERPERAGRGGRLTSDDDVRGVNGSTRLEAKRQRRRDGRDSGRRRAPILTEAEFLARREAVDRAMVIRQRGERTQIAVLEDDVLVEHYVTQAQATSFAGNVYLGRVQNVLPSMEAAFIDIGKGRNAVLYAGEVNWDAAGLSGKQRSIEQALKTGDKVVVQVTKDPIGHKGARLTQQINLPGRFLVFVPGGSMTGISRKLPDTERNRLKDILKRIVPEDAGVIIRTAAEGASEEELTRDVNRLTAQWEVIQKKAESAQNSSGGGPTLLYGEPDLAIRVIRDVFNEDFKELVVQGDEAWDTVEAYVAHVSPELSGRLTRYTGEGDVFSAKRVDEQLAKALDRKVWLPSGGSLVIDRTEAMTVIDVNTGKFVGAGGNLEQTVTRNNMEAAEEIVRQLRLRDIGGIIVIDFIDMVLESNRDLVLRRLTECLGRDRTKHQVAEVTSLGLVQMTRKRVGQGLLEVFSEPCEHCRGRGVLVHTEPVDERRRGGGNGGGTSRRDRSGGREAVRETTRDAAKAPAKDTARASVEGIPADGGGTTVEPVPATVSPDGAHGSDATSADDSGDGRGRRGRGRRSRGQAGGEREAEDAAVLTASRDDDGSAGGAGRAAVDDAPAESGEADAGPVDPDGLPEAVLPAVVAPAEPSGAESSGGEPSGAGSPEAGSPEAGSPGGEPSGAGSPGPGSPGGERSGGESSGGESSGTEPGSATSGEAAPLTARPRRRRAASRPAGPPA